MAIESKCVGDILKTSGPILKPGSFISSSGAKCYLSEQDIDMIYGNFTEPIPMEISTSADHNGTPEIPGYAIKLNKNGNTITYDGAIFNSNIVKTAISKGYTSISPEIDFTTDSFGKIVNAKLHSLRFVKNPAMPDNTTEITRFKFSMPEEEPKTTESAPANPSIDINQVAEIFNNVMMPKIESMINEKFNSIKAPEIKSEPDKGKEFFEKLMKSIPKEEQPKVEETKPVESESFESIKLSTMNDPVSKDVFDEYSKTQAELAKREIEIKKLREEVEKTKKKEYAEIRNEIKNLGVTDPDKLVSHIEDYDQKIKTLQAFKGSIAKTTPMNSNESVPPMSNEGGSNKNKKVSSQEILINTLRELHADPNSNYYRDNADRFLKVIENAGV